MKVELINWAMKRVKITNEAWMKVKITNLLILTTSEVKINEWSMNEGWDNYVVMLTINEGWEKTYSMNKKSFF